MSAAILPYVRTAQCNAPRPWNAEPSGNRHNVIYRQGHARIFDAHGTLIAEARQPIRSQRKSAADLITCADPGFCNPARPAPFQQIYFEGIGSFKNVHDVGDDGTGDPVAADGELRWFEVHIEDIGEPGRNGTHRSPHNSCPLDGFDALSAGGEEIDEDGQDCRRCPDFYRFLLHETDSPGSPVVYEAVGYITGGNLQMHPAVGQ